MMNWVKLHDYPNEFISRGAIFRFPAKYPYEEMVDLILFQPSSDESGMGFLVNSGYKAGLIAQILPKESGRTGYTDCVVTAWLKENWNHWVYPECSMKDVWVSEGYPVPAKQA